MRYLLVAVLATTANAQKYSVTLGGKNYEADCSTLQNLDCADQSKPCISRPVCALYGIPYARQPTPETRFQKAVELNSTERINMPWTNNVQKQCAQVDPFSRTAKGSEDCLVVDIYIPLKKFFTSKDETIPLAMLVLLEGIELQSGIAHTISPTYGSAGVDSVLAVVHYRLGALGFLTTENMNAAPNIGLFDQQMALKFLSTVKDSMKLDSITLLGFGAGAVSGSLHMLNSESSKYFEKVLLSGGSAISPDERVSVGRNNSFELGKYLNCPLSSDSALLRCLRQVPVYDLVTAANKLYPEVKFAAIIDRNFTDTPFINGSLVPLMQITDYSKVKRAIYGYPLNAGMNHFTEKTSSTSTPADDGKTEQQNIINFISNFLGEYERYEETRVAVAKAAMNQYYSGGSMNDFNDKTARAEITTTLLTDYMVGAPVQMAILSHLLQGNPDTTVFSYVFESEEGLPSLSRTILKNAGGDPKNHSGMLDDLLYFTGCTEVKLDRTTDTTGGKYMDLLKNFQLLVSKLTSSESSSSGNAVLATEGYKKQYRISRSSDTYTVDVYRLDYNRFWLAVLPMFNALELSNYRYYNALKNTMNVQTAEITIGSLVAVLVVLGLVVVILAVFAVKMKKNNSELKYGSTAEPGVHYNQAMDTVRTQESERV